MISYDNYKNRIEKLAKFRRILHKFRFVICGALVLIVGTSVGLMCAKGAYTTGMSLSAQNVMFNEDYEVTAASAFLSASSDQRIEYRGESGEWTTEKPVKAGKYSARTVTKKLVGYSYSPAVNFEIMPISAEFTIVGDSVTYGDIPFYTVSKLLSEHSLVESSLEFDYKEYGVPYTEVSVDVSSIKIVDADGEDFTCCYDFGTPVGKEMSVGKRNINVRPVAQEITYDAQPHFAGNDVAEETLERLVKGDTLTVTTIVSNYSGVLDGGAVNAGGYSVSCATVSIMHGETDISAWYSISRNSAQLKINRRKLTISTGDAEKPYDGKPAENTQFDCENLVGGHVAAADSSTLCKDAEVGSYPNEFEVTVLDGLTDVSHNYEIDKVNSHYGTLKINTGKLTVTTSDESGTYDGTPFTYFGFEVAEKHKLSSDFVFTAVESLAGDTTEVGTYDNVFEITVMLHGKEVTDNFEISYTYGKLTVLTRFITVTTVGDSKVFDGKPLTYKEVTEENVVENQTLKEKTPFSVTDVTAEDGVEIDAKFTVVDAAGRDVGKNYDINYINGRLIVTPRHITVTTSTPEAHVYDGNAFFDTGYTTDLEGGALYNGDELVLTGSPAETTNAGTVSNKNDFTAPNANYVIDKIIYGTLTVSRKEVKVTINPVTSVYGEEIPDNGFTLDCGELPNGETLKFTAHYEQGGVEYAPETWEEIYTLLNVGIYDVIDNDDAAIVGGNARVGNYKFEFVAGTLEITARVIVVTTATDEKFYDGKPLENDGYTTVWAEDSERKGLLNGDVLKKDTNNTVINPPVAGPYSNVCNYQAPNSNYELAEPKFGTLTIKPRPVIVYTGSATKPYDGTPLTCGDYTVKYAVEVDGKWVADESKDGLVIREDTGVMDTLSLTGSLVSITDAGEAENANRYENGNYDIKDYVNGKLNVEKHKVVFALSYLKSQYGEQKVLEEFALTFADALVNGERLEVIHKFKQNGEFVKLKDVGTYVTVEDSYKVYSASGEIIENGENNYDIEFKEGKFEILPLPVTVDINDGTAVYGEDVSAKEYGVTSDPAELPYDEQLTLTYKYDREVKDVGDYDIFKYKVYIDGEEVDPENCNYDFTFNKGTLTVTPKELTVFLSYCDKNEEIYYGTPWTYAAGIGNFALAYGLVDGEQLEITAALNAVSGDARYNEETGKYEPAAGRYATCMTGGKIYVDGVEKENGLNNYNVTQVSGGLTVLKKAIEVTFDDDNIVYGQTADGKTYTFTVTDGLDEQGELPYGENLTIESFTYSQDGEQVTPRDAGEYAIEGETVLINGAEDGADNYEITYKGALTVDRKVIDIKLKGLTIEYGEPYPEANSSGWYVNFYVFKDSGEFADLEYNDYLMVKYKNYTQNGEEITPRNVGEYVMSVAQISCIYASGGAEHGLTEFKNYVIHCDDGILKITPRPITVTVDDKTATYDGDLPENSFTVTEGALQYDDQISLTYKYDREVKDVGDYDIIKVGVYIDGKEVDPENCNYDFTFINGTLTVNPLDVYVVLNDNNTTTYGTPPEETGHVIYLDEEGTERYTLQDGCNFAADYDYYKFDDADKTTVNVRNVGYYGIKAVNARIETSDGKTSGNYEVHVIDGKLTVEKKRVTVVLNSIDPVYYGDTFTYAACVDNYANADTIELAYNERLEVAVGYLIDGVAGTPKNANYNERRDKYTYVYSARLNADLCNVYEADGVTEVENGAGNYEFDCEDLEDLKILRRTLYIYLLDYSEQYGDFAGYEDYIGNYKHVEYPDGENRVEGVPYNEQFNVGVEYLDVDGNVVEEAKNVGVYSIRLNLSETTAYDEDGNPLPDGLENYGFATAEPYRGTLEIVPREVTLILSNYWIEYGEFGTEFAYPDEVNNYDTDNSDTPAYDEQIKVAIKYQLTIDGEIVDVTPKDARVYSIVGVDYTVYDGEETVDKNNYSVSYEPGSLTIKQKQIYIDVDDASCTYGDDLPESTYVIKDSQGIECQLPYGDEFTIQGYRYCDYDAAYFIAVTPRNAGLYKIFVNDGKVVNGTDDVTINYAILQVECYGTLTVNKADLKLQLLEVQSAGYGDYRGYPAGAGNFDAEKTVGIKYNDNFELAVEYEVYRDYYETGLVTVGDKSSEIPRNAAWYYINLVASDSVIHTTDGKQFDLELNYNVECEHYEFDIFKRDVSVIYTLSTYTYGETVEKPAFTVSVHKTNLDQSEISTTELPYGEICDFDIEYENAEGTPVNAGIYHFHIAKRYVNGSEDSAKNYYFSLRDGNMLTINKKQIEITLDDITAAYGDLENNLPATHTFTPESALEYTDALTVNIAFTEVGKESVGTFVTPKNVGEYSVVATQFALTYSDGSTETAAGNALKNYEIVCNHGTLEITPKKLHVEFSEDLSVEYGQPLPNDVPYKINGETEFVLPYGDRIAVAHFYHENDDGNYTIVYDGAAINLDSEDPNYEITGDDGLLTITPRAIEVTIKGGTAVYGYEGVPEIGYEITAGKMVGEEKLVPAYVFSQNGTECDPIKVGKYDIEINEEECSVKGGKARYGNYNVTYKIEGQFEILQREIEITFDVTLNSFAYGDDFDAAICAAADTKGALETVQIAVTYAPKTAEARARSLRARSAQGFKPKAAGDYIATLDFDNCTVFDKDGNPVDGGIGNYKLKANAEPLEFTIKPMKLHITVVDASITYGDALPTELEYWAEEAMPYNESLELTFSYEDENGKLPVHKGTYPVTVTAVIPEGDIGNYTPVYSNENPTLTIDEKSVNIKLNDLSVPFGTGVSYNVTANNYDVTASDQLIDGDVLTVTEVSYDCENPVNAGTYTIIYVSCSVVNASGEDATGDYAVTSKDGGILTISNAFVTVYTASAEKPYDGTALSTREFTSEGDLHGYRIVVDEGSVCECINVTEGDGVDNTTKFKIVDEHNVETKNIVINYGPDNKTYGKLKIKKKPVTVALNSGVKVQYGNDYTQALTAGAVTLVSGEKIKLAVTVVGGVNGAGTYKAKADWANSVISNASGEIKNGINNYEPEFIPASVIFEILPREISVTLNADGKTQFAYGDDYDAAIRTATVVGMLEGETLNIAVTYGATAPKYVGDYTAELDWKNCSVVGGDKANYKVGGDTEVAFKIIAKEITVYMDDIDVRYGETPAYADGENGGRAEELVYGDTIKAVPAFEKNGESVSSFFAGTYDIVCGGIEVNGGAVDAKNYSVKTGKPYGTLTVTGIGIQIVRKTVSKTYDGTPIELDENAPEDEVGYIINEDESLRLPEGYRLVLDGTFATADGNVSSSCANTAKYKVVYNGSEAGDFIVSYANSGARLEIVKKVINVTTDTPEARDYNGTALTAESCTYDEGELVSGHVLTASGYAALTDADSIPNTVDITITAGGKDVTANYDIKLTCGTLTVNKLAVTVTIECISLVYGEDTGANKINRYNLINNEKLSYRVKYLKDGEPCGTGLLDVDVYDIVADNSTLSVSGGKISNYNVTFNGDATLTVTQRHIIVTTANGVKEYDGTALSKPDGYTTEWIKGGVRQGVAGLINGDTLTVVEAASLTEAGNCDNVCTYTAPTNYYIEEDMYVYGKLTVNKRLINVTTGGITGEYKGTPYTEGSFDCDRLLDEHTMERTGELIGFLDVISDADNEFTVKITEKTTDGERDVTGNYNIKYTYGKVNITKRRLTVTLDGGQTEFGYGVDSLDEKFKNVTAGNLASDDELTTVALIYNTGDGTAPVNCGSYTVTLDEAKSFIKYAGEGNGIGNYEIVCSPLAFKITKRSVALTLGEWAAEEYDGKEHVYDTDGCGPETLYNGEKLSSVAVIYSRDKDGLQILDGAPIDAGTYYVIFDSANSTVSGANGETSIKTNYEVACEPLQFVIKPKKFKITLSDVEHTYNGEAYVFAKGKGFTADLCDGDEIKCNVSYADYDEAPVSVGEYTVTFGGTVEFTKGKAGNYELDVTNSKLSCTLKIKKRDIIVIVADRSVETGKEEYTKADISAGFVGNDIDLVTAVFTYTDKLPKPENVLAYKTVGVTLSGEIMNNYNVKGTSSGILTVTERRVRVTPLFIGEDNTYDGSALAFDFDNVHDVEDAAEDDKFGFTEEDRQKLEATFTYEDATGVHTGTPVKAGTYTVRVKLSGEGLKGYFVEYSPLTFTVKKRKVSYKLEVEGAREYVYTNSLPAFSATLTQHDGFIDDEVPAHTVGLSDGQKPVDSYDVGTYQVIIRFAEMENYDIKVNSAEIKITRRTIVVIPVDPYEGKAKLYAGGNLKLGALDREILNNNPDGIGLADGDYLTVESNEIKPTVTSGTIAITEVTIVRGEKDVSDNYNVITAYNRADATIEALGLAMRHFSFTAKYEVREIPYELKNVGDSYTYDGNAHDYVLTADSKIIVSEEVQQILDGFGVEMRLPVSVRIPAAADDYLSVLTKAICVYDGDGNKLSVFGPVCTNTNEIIVEVKKAVIDVDWDNNEVTFKNAASVCTAELHEYTVDGSKLTGITLVNANGVDVSANYKLDENCVAEDGEVKIISLAEAKKYALPEIKVEIDVGDNFEYTYDDESRWVLQGGYEVKGSELLQTNGHKLQVLVFKENDGYLFGVNIYSETDGKHYEAGTNYRVIVKSDVNARYLKLSEMTSLKREIHVDLSGAFEEDGTPRLDENGLLTGYSAEGLNKTDAHIIEVTLVEISEDTYKVEVVIYQLWGQGTKVKKNNMAGRYDFDYTLPDSAANVTEVILVTDSLN